MMKYFPLTCAILFVAVSLANGEISEDDANSINDTIVNGIRKKYLKLHKEGVVKTGISKFEESCPGSEQKLKIAIARMTQCAETVDDSLTICQGVQEFAQNCSKPLIDIVDGCLPGENTGLANLGMRSLISVVDYFCGLRGEDILELFNPCLHEEPSVITAQLEECEAKALEIARKYDQALPTREQICSITELMKPCIIARSNVTCKNEKTRKAFIGLVEAIASPCNNINEV